jgi:Flp pilus assembly protein TadD
MPSDIAKLQNSPREVARWQKAQQQLLGGRRASAISGYRELLLRFPAVPQLWFEMGMAAAQELNFTLAEQAFGRAREMSSKDASLLVLLGQQYHRLRRLADATDCFERALRAEPSSIPVRLNLAAWYERQRRVDDALQCVEECLAQHPGDRQVVCVRALLLHRKGRGAEAESIARDLIKADARDPNVRFSSRHLLAVLLDESGQYAEAMRWLCEAKAEIRKAADIAALEQNYDRADQFRRQLLAGLTSEAIAAWRKDAAPLGSSHQLAFLGGHPRSGTTLLEQVLAAHPALAAIDESEAFPTEIWDQLAPMHAAQPLTPASLNALSAERRAGLGRNYFKSLLRELPADMKPSLVLDKNPSPTAALHLFLRIFPRLKVIIALRDPRDVVVSCFFQNLTLTAANANFLSLERTVKHFADLMDVWVRLRELGGFDWIESRYEDVVGDLEREGRRVTEFLGLPWHEQQAAFRENREGKFVFSPTFSDVAKPVHRRAVGRWQHYAEHLAPFQEKLARYCRSLGYDS